MTGWLAGWLGGALQLLAVSQGCSQTQQLLLKDAEVPTAVQTFSAAAASWEQLHTSFTLPMSQLKVSEWGSHDAVVLVVGRDERGGSPD